MFDCSLLDLDLFQNGLKNMKKKTLSLIMQKQDQKAHSELGLNTTKTSKMNSRVTDT